jgi:type IV pilus assembly protein PilW
MSTPLGPRAGEGRSRGFTLIELMIAMTLGVIVVGGVVSVVLAGQQSYRTNEALSQVQESARTAFELMARDIRQAGVNGCGNNGRVANVLDPEPAFWWQTWFGIRGYEGATADPAVDFGTAGEDNRKAGTDSIQLQGIEGMGLSVETHEPVSANLKINAETPDIARDDILVVCDFDHSAIFQVSGYNDANVTVVHSTGEGVADPGNCTKGLGYPTAVCPDTVGNSYTFGPNSQVARFTAVDWYIGANERNDEGGWSLYRVRLDRGATLVVEEIVAGVTDMQILYRRDGANAFVPATDASLVGNWDSVNAVTLTLTLDSAGRRVTTDTTVNSGRLQRSFSHLVTLRNRVP